MEKVFNDFFEFASQFPGGLKQAAIKFLDIGDYPGVTVAMLVKNYKKILKRI